jgi:predicted dehydrogenase
MGKQMRIGLIGLGGMANAHIHMLSELENAVVTAICDVNSEQLNKIGNKLSIAPEKRFTHYDELINDQEVDGVISIVPNNLHAGVIRTCILNKKPVMTEKPFTLNFKEAQELERLYKENPIPVMVGFSYRYIPSFRYAKDLITNNRLGKIRHLTVQYLQEWGSPLFEVPFQWRFRKEVTGSGSLGDLGSHMIDCARFIIGEFVGLSSMVDTFVKERKMIDSDEMMEVDVDDYASFQVLLENGVRGSFLTSRNAIGSGNQLELTIYGDLGTLNICCERPDEITFCIKDEQTKQGSFITEKVPSEYKRNQLQDFLDLLSGDDPINMPTFYDGYQNQKILEKIQESALTGCYVQIEE